MLSTVPRGVAFGSWSRSFRRWGASIHAALPGKSRHPLRALDERAMELASAGRRAARGAVPLRGRDAGLPLARRPRPPPAPATSRRWTTARRRSRRRCACPARRRAARRSARRPRRACATWRTASSSGETPRAALKTIRHLWENGAAVSLDLLGEATVTEAEADRYAARCLRRARDARPARRRRGRERPVLEADSLGPAAAREPVGEGLRAHPAAAPRGARGGPRGRRPAHAPAARCAREELGAHLHIDMESVDTLEATLGLVFELLDEPELRDGPSAGRRDAGLPARVARAARAGARLGARRPRASSRSWCGW